MGPAQENDAKVLQALEFGEQQFQAARDANEDTADPALEQRADKVAAEVGDIKKEIKVLDAKIAKNNNPTKDDESKFWTTGVIWAFAAGGVAVVAVLLGVSIYCCTK